jgi:hypothetical protein
MPIVDDVKVNDAWPVPSVVAVEVLPLLGPVMTVNVTEAPEDGDPAVETKAVAV